MKNNNAPAGLRSPGLLGKKPLIGLLMFIFGSMIFVILAYNLVNNGPLMNADLPVTKAFYNLALNSPPLLTNVMIAGYYIGIEGIVVVALILTFYFLYKRFWRELTMVVVSLGLSGFIFLIFSNIFKRVRPSYLFDTQIWSGNNNLSGGFPSGHVLSTLVCFGFLAYLLVPRIKSYLGKFLVVFLAFSVILYMGFSRLYLGDHYLTDVIAGYALGIAWFGLAYTSIELIFKKLRDKKEKENENRAKDYE